MPGVDWLAAAVARAGFSCTGCSECCRQIVDDSNLVAASPPEIREIMEYTGMAWEEIAEPYPDFIKDEGGKCYTFTWCIRRSNDACMFLRDGRCTIYAHRPWICRTYPFMLVGEELLISECPGVGTPLSDEEARTIALLLIERQEAELREEACIRVHFEKEALPDGRRVVIDSEGVKVLDA